MEAQKAKSGKKSGIHPNSADPNISPKGTLTYLIRYMAQIFQMLLPILLVMKTHQTTEKSGTNLGLVPFLAISDHKYV